MRCHRSSAATKRAPARAQPKWAAAFCVEGSLKRSRVYPDTRFALLLPTPQTAVAQAIPSQKIMLWEPEGYIPIPARANAGGGCRTRIVRESRPCRGSVWR